VNTADREAFAEHHPHPGNDPWARLGHVLELFPDQGDDEIAVPATMGAYSDDERTGLTYGDLRAIANAQFARKSTVKALTVLFASASCFAGAWWLMTLVGILHHQWWRAIPTMSYTAALQVSFLLGLVALVVVVARGVIAAVRS
jgi:hypothetical protein